MNGFEILTSNDTLEVSTGYGNVKLNLGRKVTLEDCGAIEAMMNLGARLYAEEIRRARIVVDDLVNWRKP
jgi:hypothetical protein